MRPAFLVDFSDAVVGLVGTQEMCISSFLIWNTYANKYESSPETWLSEFLMINITVEKTLLYVMRSIERLFKIQVLDSTYHNRHG